MTEEFLHYIWKYRLFNQDNLISSNGEKIVIQRVGEYNSDSGPDFFNAQIKIGKTTWAGNVEIHLDSSSWNKHNHNKDNAYNNLILHVVYNNDQNNFRKNGELIPTLELKNYFDEIIYDRYIALKNSILWIPCQNSISSVNKFTLNNWVERLLVERLERKTTSIYNSLKLNKNNWEETFYQYLAANFGFNTNSQAFEMLAKSLPQKYIAKHKNNLFQVEALLFGQAGMLEKKFNDEYPQKLKREYDFLKAKFSLVPLQEHLWKFFRVRPSNFPTIRIAQFAELIYNSSKLFSKIIEMPNMKELKKIFSVSPSSYWLTHYYFDKSSPRKTKKISDSSVNLILLNTVIPLVFAYSKQKDDEKLKQKILSLYEIIEGENNSVIAKWKELGIPVKTAYYTQALLELKKQYCNNKKCLECAVGVCILKKN
ncbi:MAG: DUF2851 family protein [Bacteroidales bacterium]